MIQVQNLLMKHYILIYLLYYCGTEMSSNDCQEHGVQSEHDQNQLNEQNHLNQASCSLKAYPSQQKHSQQHSLNCLPKLLLAFIIFLLMSVTLSLSILYFLRYLPIANNEPIQYHNVGNAITFPKVLWVLCGEGGVQGLPMVHSLLAQHQISVGNASGWEVRVVTTISAYDWLSPHTVELIRKAKHTTQFHIPIEELLRIALLLEHGGLSAQTDSIVFTEGLHWVETLFSSDFDTLKENKGIHYCFREGGPQLVLFAESMSTIKWFDIGIIMARPQSRLLRELLEQMTNVLVRNRRFYDPFQSFGWYNSDGALSMKGFFSNLINFRSHYWNTGEELCREYGVLQINRKQGSFMRVLYDWGRITQEFLKEKQQVYKEEGSFFLYSVDLDAFRPQIIDIARFQNLNAPKGSLLREILDAQGNQWLAKPINKVREVSLCIVSLKPIPSNYQQTLASSVSRLTSESFKRWEAIFFVQDLISSFLDYSFNPAVKLVNASEWQGLNLQRAATLYCKPQAIILLFDYDESFTSQDSLTSIAEAFRDKDVFGASLSIKAGEQTIIAELNKSSRVKNDEERQATFKKIHHCFRAFSVFSYRLVAPFELHDHQGRYFNREIPFNFLLQLQPKDDSRCQQTQMKFRVKKAESKGAQLPRKHLIIPLTILTPELHRIEYSLPQYHKHDAHDWCEALEEYYQRIQSSLDGFFVLNDGQQFTGMQARKQMPQLIPRKIHQIWIGSSPMPAFKELLIGQIKRLYPNYNHTIWTNQHITRNNFPKTYDIIQTLLEFNKHSPSDKMAMISDLMRLEIIYKEGGFYFDTNYHLFRSGNLEDWRSFQLVLPAQLVPFYKFQRENSVFASVPNHPHISRLLDHRRLSTRNFFSRAANLQTGPAYLTFAIQGEEELLPTIYQPAYEYIYPWLYNSPLPNACEAPQGAPEGELLFKHKKAYWKNCSQAYPHALGIQYFLEGGTWLVERQKK